MTIRNALNLAIAAHKGERKILECEILLSHILQKERIFLHTHDDLDITDSILEKLLSQVMRLNAGYPLEYITQSVSFFSHNFFISEGALIPRPETEILVQKTSNLITQHNIKQIYEIGIGSGIISIVLCLLHNNLRALGTDISQEALEVARRNITLKGTLDSSLGDRIELFCTNLLDDVAWDKNALIVSNPPYIAQSYEIPKNLAFEPQIALFGGKNGDEILRAIITLNPRYLACEIGYNQAHIKAFLHEYNNVEFYKDYAGFWRGFTAWR